MLIKCYGFVTKVCFAVKVWLIVEKLIKHEHFLKIRLCIAVEYNVWSRVMMEYKIFVIKQILRESLVRE